MRAFRCECGREISLQPEAEGKPVLCGCGRRHAAIGEVVGKVRILDLLGQGGMGVVYKARHVDLDRVVALKVLSPAVAADPEFVKRFYREARAAAQVSDPNVVQIYEVGHDGEKHYIVMEYADGLPLSTLLAEGAFPVPQAVGLMEQMLRALKVVHATNLLHRDIKPANIIVDPKGRVKLADFGLARRAQGEESLTATGFVLGTPRYMSPEQARGQELDARSDLYSLGVVFYEMLSGRVPFEADTPVKLMMKHASPDAAPPLIQVDPKTPAALSRLVARMLAKSRDGRIPDATRALDELAAARKGLGPATEAARRPATTRRERPVATTAVEAPAPPPAPRRWIWPAAACAAVACVVGSWMLLGRRKPPPAPPAERPSMPAAGGTVTRHTELLALLRDGRLDQAESLSAELESKGPSDRLREFRALLAKWRAALRLADQADYAGTLKACETLLAESSKLVEAEDRAAWESVIAPMTVRMREGAALQEALDRIASEWASEERPPPKTAADHVAVLMRQPDHPVARKYQAWVALRAEKQIAQAERLLAQGKAKEAVELFEKLDPVLPFEPWKQRIQAGLERGRAEVSKPPAKEGLKPLYEIALDFVPSDFVVTSDGAHVVALDRANGRTVLVSLAERKTVRRADTPGEPTALAQVGDHVYVCGRTAGSVAVLDAKTLEPVGTVELPLRGPHAIAVASEARPPRVFVASKDGSNESLVEIDPAARKVVRSASIRNALVPATLQVTPGGERLFVKHGYRVDAWRTRDGIEIEGVNAPSAYGALRIDGQGQYLVGSDHVYDQLLDPQCPVSPRAAAVAVHPRLPYAVCYVADPASLLMLDLYRLRPGTSHLLDFSVRQSGPGLPLLQMVPDARAAVLGRSQDPSGPNATGTSWLYVLPLPWKEAPGYFAFTSPPPSTAWVGFPMRYDARVSEPFASAAQFGIESAPDGMTWHAAKRTVEWTPSVEQIGRREFQIKAVATGIEIRRTVAVDVRYRVVLRDAMWDQVRLSGENRFLYGVGGDDRRAVRTFDFETDASGSIPLGLTPNAMSDAEGRLYWIDPRNDEISSCNLVDGSDVRRHPMRGLRAVALVPYGRRGPMLGVFAGTGRSHRLLPVGMPDAEPVATSETGPEIGVSPDGTVLFAPDSSGMGLFRFQDGAFKRISWTELTPGVLFSHDGTHVLSGNRMYELRGMRRIRRFSKASARFDPAGPYFGVPAREAVEVFPVGASGLGQRIELRREGSPKGVSVTPMLAIPLSKRGLVVVVSTDGCILMPHKF